MRLKLKVFGFFGNQINPGLSGAYVPRVTSLYRGWSVKTNTLKMPHSAWKVLTHLICICFCVCGRQNPKVPKIEPHGWRLHYIGWYRRSGISGVKWYFDCTKSLTKWARCQRKPVIVKYIIFCLVDFLFNFIKQCKRNYKIWFLFTIAVQWKSIFRFFLLPLYQWFSHTHTGTDRNSRGLLFKTLFIPKGSYSKKVSIQNSHFSDTQVCGTSYCISNSLIPKGHDMYFVLNL